MPAAGFQPAPCCAVTMKTAISCNGSGARNQETLRRWAEAGAPLGDSTHLPPIPHYPEGWPLDKPGMTNRMPKPFSIGAAAAAWTPNQSAIGLTIAPRPWTPKTLTRTACRFLGSYL